MTKANEPAASVRAAGRRGGLRRWALALAALAVWMAWPGAAWARDARSVAGELKVGAGDAWNGWLLLTEPEPAKKRDDDAQTARGERGRGPTALLLHVPAEAAPGTIRRVQLLAEPPARVAAGGGRLVMAFESARGAAGATTPVWQMREVRAERVGQDVEYSQPLALPPLDGIVALEGLAVCGPRVWALGREAPGEAEAGRAVLRVMSRAGWSAAELPAGVAAGAMLELADRPVLIESLVCDGEDGAGAATCARMWRGEVDEAGGPVRWEQVATVRTGVATWAGGQWMVVDGQVVRVAPDAGELSSGEQVWRVNVPTVGGPGVEVRLPSGARERWLVPAGPTLGWYWVTPGPEGRLRALVMSLAGTRVFDGAAITASPLSTGDLGAVLLALISLAAGVVAFVFKPRAARAEAVRLPEGWALAAPWKRVVAALIDLCAALGLASALLGVTLGRAMGLGLFEAQGSGLGPFVLTLVLLVVVSALGELTTGRTPGKWMLGLRTVSADGRGVGAGQALARNLVKGFCPPLAVLLMTPAPEGPSGLFGTLVLERVVSPGED